MDKKLAIGISLIASAGVISFIPVFNFLEMWFNGFHSAFAWAAFIVGWMYVFGFINENY